MGVDISDRDDAERFISGVVEKTHLRNADLLVDPQLSKGDGWKPPNTKNLDSDPLSRPGPIWTFKASPEGGVRSARALFAAPRRRPTTEHITATAQVPHRRTA